MNRPSLVSLLAIAAAALAASAIAQQGPKAAPGASPPPASVTPMTPEMNPSYKFQRPDADYIRRTAMIPMRDGVKLFTVIVMRKGAANGPMLLTRTPYNANKTTMRNDSPHIEDILPLMDAEFVNDGYIRVYQDVRGRAKSEGDFVMNRPIRGPLNKTAVDEATDAYDTIDWLVKNTPESNGRVATTGSSYPGFTSLVSTIDPHPALKAAVPQSPMVDGWMGDDWFHNGAFRQTNYDYITSMTFDPGDNGNVPTGTVGDDYTLYLRAGSSGDFARKYGLDSFPFTRKLIENPAYTDFWSQQAVDKWVVARPFTVPTMLVVGQWDQEDSYGAPATYKALKDKPGADGKLHLVIGPWRHSGVNYDGSMLGPLKFKGDTALEWRKTYMKPFLDHYLKDAPDPHLPAAITYATGVDKWELQKAWPAGRSTPIYLQANGKLDFARPAASKADHDDYVSDPARPVPFVARPVHMRDRAIWTTWLVADQRFADGRPDVVTYETEPLKADLHIAGQPMVDLFAATTGTDSDFAVKLIDVYPEAETYHPEMAGAEIGIGIEIFRGRYVEGFGKPRALKAGKVENFKFGLPNVDHVFLKGHRVQVQVQSSLFPLYDRNPQTYVPNIFNARPDDYVKATQSIYRAGAQASAVWLPVVEK
jgi:putative CocE/NonD family hydrolase